VGGRTKKWQRPIERTARCAPELLAGSVFPKRGWRVKETELNVFEEKLKNGKRNNKGIKRKRSTPLAHLSLKGLQKIPKEKKSAAGQ